MKTRLKVPIFNCFVTLFTDVDMATIDEDDNILGVAVQIGDMDYTIHIKNDLDESEFYTTLSHEANHVVCGIADDLGIPTTFDNSEFHCYLHDYLINEFKKRIERKKRSTKNG